MSLQWTSSRHSAPYLGTLTPRATKRQCRVEVTHRTQTPSIPVKTSICSERDACARVRASRAQHLISERRHLGSERDRETRACSIVKKQRCSNCPKGLILSFEMRSVIVNLRCQNRRYLIFAYYLHQNSFVHPILPLERIEPVSLELYQ